MKYWRTDPFQQGSSWIRSDFHLHTKADKEFKYTENENDFCKLYIDKLKKENIRLGVITNHNKFDRNEFKALRKKGKSEGIYLLPGVELSVNDGANGVHTLIVFSEEWLEKGNDYINQFLNIVFAGKTPNEYENENGRSNYDIITTLKNLKEFDRDFFIVFAHVEAPSGLWNEIAGGRMEELASEPLIKEYCFGFQKVRTHDKADKACRTKVQNWWCESYPAEVEGSDPKEINHIGRGEKCYLKIGDFNFESIKYALQDYQHRCAKEFSKISHSYIKSIRFEGGILDGKKILFSKELNCLIGIRGSGKSSILECIRYALNIAFGQKSQDVEYKTDLVPFLLKSGGKIIIECVDKLGHSYEIHRILDSSPDIYVDSNHRPGISIQDTILKKPLYFGQKDLSASGEGFGTDLVEKLVGDDLKSIRDSNHSIILNIKSLVEQLKDIESDAEQISIYQNELKDINYKLEIFQKHDLEEKLSKQVEFQRDITHCKNTEESIDNWIKELKQIASDNRTTIIDTPQYLSKVNSKIFIRYSVELKELIEKFEVVENIPSEINEIKSKLVKIREELELEQASLKDEFAKIEREVVKSLEENGVTAIQPDDFKTLTKQKDKLLRLIGSLQQKSESIDKLNNLILEESIKLNNGWQKEFQAVKQKLSLIFDSKSTLKVNATFKGDKQVFSRKMEEIFKGTGIRKETFQQLAEKYPDFIEIFRNFEDALSLVRNKSQLFKDTFMKNIFEFISFQVPNVYEIIYREKPLKSHSLGQRASALILFILNQKENDVIFIDQPEDDLDNQIIYDEIVKLIRKLKVNQQFIFATHNANFPVLGDAELIITCTFTEKGMDVNSGSIDCKEVQSQIVNIMEGGIEAFDRRKAIYQLWRS